MDGFICFRRSKPIGNKVRSNAINHCIFYSKILMFTMSKIAVEVGCGEFRKFPPKLAKGMNFCLLDLICTTSIKK